MRKLIAACALIGMLCAAEAQEPQPRSIRAYHVGNSLTFGAMSGLPAFMGSRGAKYQAGWHVFWGGSLAAIWAKEDTPSNATPKYGNFRKALTEHEWDVLTLQSWGAVFEGEKGDVAMAKQFIELALPKSPDVQVYIYEAWPFKDKEGKLDFAAKWGRGFPKPGQWDSVYDATYCKELVKRLNQEMPDLKKPVKLIPAGSVMAELDQQVRAGKVPDLTAVEALYKDDVHLTAVGNYMVHCTFYAVLVNDTPVGLPIPKEVFEGVGKSMQAAAWKVVSEMDATGVVVPPATPTLDPAVKP